MTTTRRADGDQFAGLDQARRDDAGKRREDRGFETVVIKRGDLRVHRGDARLRRLDFLRPRTGLEPRQRRHRRLDAIGSAAHPRLRQFAPRHRVVTLFL